MSREKTCYPRMMGPVLNGVNRAVRSHSSVFSPSSFAEFPPELRHLASPTALLRPERTGIDDPDYDSG